MIAAVIARVGGARVAAVKDDVEQEVVVSLWKQIEREPAFAPSSSYVYTAAVRETVRAIRREQGRRQEPLEAV
ncbi:MAG TPA: sigma factor, partial [Vicinamibacteria bacterium]|nr:sigma factor [Vicinamibacteria bacterium]